MDKGTHDEIMGENYRGSFWNFSDKNAAEIEREIRVTRADLDETVTALQARLAPQQMVNHFMDITRDTLRDSAPRMAEAIRKNPLPASLVAIGLGWLFLRAVSPPKPRRTITGYNEFGEPYYITPEGQYSATELSDESGEVTSDVKHWAESTGQKVKESTFRMKEKARDKASHLAQSSREAASRWAESTREKAGHWAESTKAKAGQLAGATKEKASHLAESTMQKAGQFAGYTKDKAGHLVDLTLEKAGHAAGYTREKAGVVAHAAGRSVQNVGHSTRMQLGRASDSTVRMYHQNPVAFWVACLGIGAAVAMSLPITRKEQEVMGETSDQLMQKAKAAGQETLEKVKHVAEAGQQAMQQEARQEGII